MSLPLKKAASGFEMPALGFGTWGIGGAQREHVPGKDDERDVQSIRNALAAGITHIDTAEIYAGGHAETLIGHAIKGRPRSSYSVASKAYKTNLAYDDLLRAFDGSCARLDLDTLDLYYLHAANHDVPFKETARALNTLLADGRIKHVGVCNFNTQSMKRLQAELDAPIAVNQSHYNLLFRSPERDGLLDHCCETGAIFLAWRPILWRYPDRENPAAGNPWDRGVYPILDEVADKHCKTNTQTALNWLIAQPNVCALFKTTNPKHLDEILGAAGWALAGAEIEDLRANFPDQRDISDAVPLS